MGSVFGGLYPDPPIYENADVDTLVPLLRAQTSYHEQVILQLTEAACKGSAMG